MKLKTVYTMCELMCDSKSDKNPNGYLIIDNEKITYTELKNELRILKNWCNPNDNTDNLQMCVFCCDCKHNKKYRLSQGRYSHKMLTLCELDKKPKPDLHYCAYGEKR